MTEQPNSSSRLLEDLTDRIDYFRQEFDITYVQVIGILEVMKSNLLMEIMHFDSMEEDIEDEGEEWKQ